MPVHIDGVLPRIIQEGTVSWNAALCRGRSVFVGQTEALLSLRRRCDTPHFFTLQPKGRKCLQ